MFSFDRDGGTRVRSGDGRDGGRRFTFDVVPVLYVTKIYVFPFVVDVYFRCI